ncbi:PREDICTED: mitotic interactor and substrate of PLK1 [Nanorana parkeri]|uniref:mitotic interactor and substrate of PLK1 n=1 Tax=Nanorana parkeri TaxID=125878 RepID=UPI000853F18B|nr:PREDICTED: mitotic interactor and substrate of PLK1 [Nanorana parkeri]
MFKYTSPWQVLCSSLEKREQVSVNGEEGSPNLPELSADYRNEYDATDSTQTIVKISTQYQIIGSSDADSGDLQKYTEDFQNPYKLKEVVSEAQTERDLDVTTKNLPADEEITYISEEQRPIITDTEVTTTTSDPAMDRVTRSMIFSLSSSRSIGGSREDLTNSTPEESQVADKGKDVWIPPPDRNSKLKVLRGEERFEIRSHRPETSPSKLFVDSDGEEHGNSRVGSHQFTPEKVWELEQERRDIIKKQGHRKSLDTEDLINLQESTDSPVTNKEVNGGQTEAEVDMEQINFEAARQQFVMLEKKRNSLPITPRLQQRPPRLSSQSLYENYSYSDFPRQKEPSILEQDVKAYQNESTVTQETTGRERSASLLRKQFLRDLSVDSIDTGKQEKSGEVYRDETTAVVSEEKDDIPNPSDETPIEREIRLALQREESLRKERGIQHSVESKEIVEIQKNLALSISPETQLPKKNKDRVRTAFFLQREIEREAQREADLKNEGKLTGLYDKGNAQEIDERRKLFEQLDEIPVYPQKITAKTISKGIITDTQEDSTYQRDSEVGNETTNLTVVDAPLPYSLRTNWKPTPLNPYRTRRLSMDNILDVRIPNDTTTVQESSVETFVHKENFQLQPLKFGLHAQEDQAEEEKDYKVEKTPVSANGVEKYSRRLRPSHSFVMEEEIRKTLEREHELQEQRRKSELPPVTTLKEDHYEYNQYGKPSLTSDGSRTWSTASRKNTPSSPLPAQKFTPKAYPKVVFSESESESLKTHENWYAGIDPSDSVNTEIVESTRVSRHKSKMALRWEAGLFANEPSE